MTCDITNAMTIFSLVLSLCALFLTGYQAYLSRTHNRLSVRPHLTTFSHYVGDDASGIIKIDLMNNGLGPAIVRNFKVLFDHKIVSENDHFKIEQFIKETFQENNYQIGYVAPQYVMPANEKMSVLTLKFPLTANTKDQFEGLLNRMDIIIEYESIYGDTIPMYNTRVHRGLNPINSSSIPLK